MLIFEVICSEDVLFSDFDKEQDHFAFLVECDDCEMVGGGRYAQLFDGYHVLERELFEAGFSRDVPN